MLRDLRNYILENEFKINYIAGKVNIVNYECIDHFSDEKVMIRHSSGTVVIKGENLIISKLLNDEILISGTVKTIELKWLKNLKVKLP